MMLAEGTDSSAPSGYRSPNNSAPGLQHNRVAQDRGLQLFDCDIMAEDNGAGASTYNCV
jgi:hypothetical protein